MDETAGRRQLNFRGLPLSAVEETALAYVPTPEILGLATFCEGNTGRNATICSKDLQPKFSFEGSPVYHTR